MLALVGVALVGLVVWTAWSRSDPAADTKPGALAEAPGSVAAEGAAPATDSEDESAGARLAAVPPGSTGWIRGQVLDRFDAPIAGARVRAATGADWSWHGREPEVFARSVTNEQGSFQLASLPLRKVYVFATAAGFVPGGSEVAPLLLSTAMPGRAGVVVRLFGARQLSGHVRDDQGRAVAGARVTAHLVESRLPWQRVEVESDAQGRFVLQPVPLGDLNVFAWKPGLGSALRTGIGAVSDLEIVIVPGEQAKLRLELVGELTGGPAAEPAVVRLLHQRGDSGQHLPRGLYQHELRPEHPVIVSDLVAGEYLANVSHPTPTRFDRTPYLERLQLEPGQTTTLVFRAHPSAAARLRGRLRDPQGAGLAGHELIFDDPWQGTTKITVRTDTGGSFASDGAFHAGQWLQVVVADESLVLLGSSRALAVKLEADVSLDLVAVPALCVRGQVVDATGASVAGATVRLTDDPHRAYNAIAGTVTGPDGRFALPGLPPIRSTPWLEVTDRRGYGRADPKLAPGGDSDVIIRLSPPTGCEGIVRLAGGQPIGGARVVCREISDASSSGVETWSDARGRYRYPALAPASYRLEATSGGVTAATPSPVEVRLGELRGGVDIELPARQPSRPVAGVVRLAGGAPAVGFDLWLWQGDPKSESRERRVTTDRDGRFRCLVAEPGEVRVKVIWPRLESGSDAATTTWRLHVGEDERFTVVAGDENVVLTLRGDIGSVSGRFVTLPGVDLPDRVWAGAILHEGDAPPAYASRIYAMPLVLDRGAFRLERVQAGSFTLCVVHPEFLTLRQPVRVTAGQHTALGDLRLVPAGSVSGRVVDRTGAPIAGVEVFILDDDEWSLRPHERPRGGPVTRSDADGRFTCRARHESERKLVLWKDGHATLWRSVPEDAGPSFVVRMLEASSVRVVLSDRSAWLRVVLDCQAPPAAAADYAAWLRAGLSEHSGGEPVTFGRLPPARYKVTVRGQRPVASGSDQTQEVVLSEHFVDARAGETATVEVRGR